MIRVTAGSARGIELRAPSGRATRPTAGRLREALFSMLLAADVDFTAVLDLYAGSGALGIEALSRGAESCTFVETDERACAVVYENLKRAHVAERGHVVRSAVGRWRAAAGGPYTLVLADPPYDDAASWVALERTVADALSETATIVVEHAAREAPPPILAGRALWRDRRQGEGAVAIYRADTDERGAAG